MQTSCDARLVTFVTVPSAAASRDKVGNQGAE